MSEHEESLNQLSKEKEKAEECQNEAKVYRKTLTDCQRLVELVRSEQNLHLLERIANIISEALDEQKLGQYSKNVAETRRIDVEWLKESLKALKEVKAAAEHLN